MLHDSHRRRFFFRTFSKYDFPMKSVFHLPIRQLKRNKMTTKLLWCLQPGETFSGVKTQWLVQWVLWTQTLCFSNTMSYLKSLCSLVSKGLLRPWLTIWYRNFIERLPSSAQVQLQFRACNFSSIDRYNYYARIGSFNGGK